ncbi:MAG: hypothetical protein IJ489_10490 [Clostridia bacterium]|nr:hypothetical protein [Clostridia bacterium]
MKKRDYLLGANIFYTKRKTSPRAKKIFSNAIFLLLTILFLLLLLHITKGYFLIAIGFSFFCLACPTIIIYGSQTILTEMHNISVQKAHRIPISFHKKKIIFAYIQTLGLFWILPCAVFLLPDKLWILTGPPIWLFAFAVLKLTEHTWLSFGWKKRVYWLSQGLIYVVFLTAALLFRWMMQY